jgi:hypothetical protein
MRNKYFAEHTISNSNAFTALNPAGTVVLFFLLDLEINSKRRLKALYDTVHKKVKMSFDSIAAGVSDLLDKGFISLCPETATYEKSNNYLYWNCTNTNKKSVMKVYFI